MENQNNLDKTTLQPNKAPIKPASERIKDEFSIVQVIASALSAATGVILAPKIGVIGGVLGVAIGAAVAAIVSQVYKSILNASAEKLKYNLGQVEIVDKETGQITYVDEDTYYPQRLAPKDLRTKAKQENKKQTVKSFFIVILLTLTAVALTAFLINKFTAGEGLGKKPQPIIVYKEVEVETPKDDTSNSEETTHTDADKDIDKQTDTENNNPENPQGPNDDSAQEDQNHNTDQEDNKKPDNNKDNDTSQSTDNSTNEIK